MAVTALYLRFMHILPSTQQVEQTHGVPVIAVVTLTNLVAHLQAQQGDGADVELAQRKAEMQAYQQQYGHCV